MMSHVVRRLNKKRVRKFQRKKISSKHHHYGALGLCVTKKKIKKAESVQNHYMD